MSWQPAKAPADISGATVITVRNQDHREAGHQIAYKGRNLLVLPDGHTTSKKRSWAIRDAIETAEYCVGGDDTTDRVAYLVGRLVLEGCRRIEVDGVPIVEPAADTVQWTVELLDSGEARIRRHG